MEYKEYAININTRRGVTVAQIDCENLEEAEKLLKNINCETNYNAKIVVWDYGIIPRCEQ